MVAESSGLDLPHALCYQLPIGNDPWPQGAGETEGEVARMEIMVCRNLQLTHLLLPSLVLAVPSVIQNSPIFNGVLFCTFKCMASWETYHSIQEGKFSSCSDLVACGKLSPQRPIEGQELIFARNLNSCSQNVSRISFKNVLVLWATQSAYKNL